MATYFATARSNFVKVKQDRKAEFDDIMSKLGFDVKQDDKGRTYLLNSDGGIEGTYYDGEDDVHVDWTKIGKMLEDGEVLHIVESGAESMRYLGGQALFVRSDGKVDHFDINVTPRKIVRFMDKYKKVPNRPYWGG